MKSPEYENYTDNKFHLFEELKMEVPDTEVPHSDCNVNNEIVSEDTELSKFGGENKIKHEDMDNGLPLNVTIKTERIVEGDILDNNKNTRVPYELNVQDVQLHSDERLLKNNVGLIKPKNEQTNMARAAELNELHKCKHCDIFFDHHDNMLIHMSLVHNKKTLKCELCGKLLSKLSNLKRHIILLHKHKESPKVAKIIFKGINCNAEFNNRLTLNNHVKLCQKEGDIITYKCDSCDGVYKSEQNLRNHMKRMHTKKEHKCKCCGAVLKTNRYLRDHIKNIHYDYGRSFNCSCGKKFRSPAYLRRHKRSQHESKIKDTDRDRFQCDSCQKIFKKKQCLVKHIKSFHYDYGGTFDCWCGKQFRSPIHLYRHKQQQHERKIKDTDSGMFQCDSCQKILKSHRSLGIHIKTVHYDYGRMFDCWCGKQFRTPVHLCRHKQYHKSKINDTDNDRFQCDSCQKIFKTKQCLVLHIKMVHYGYGRTFDCWCGKQFRTPVHLHRHKQRQHERKIKDTDNDKFQCDSCQKTFKKKQCLVRHIKMIHYDYGRMFDCWCGKQFRSPIHLYRHKQQRHKHTDTDRFQYDSCQKIYKKKQSLVIHIKRVY